MYRTVSQRGSRSSLSFAPRHIKTSHVTQLTEASGEVSGERQIAGEYDIRFIARREKRMNGCSPTPTQFHFHLRNGMQLRVAC